MQDLLKVAVINLNLCKSVHKIGEMKCGIVPVPLLPLLAPGVYDAIDGLVGEVVVLSDSTQGFALFNVAEDIGPLGSTHHSHWPLDLNELAIFCPLTRECRKPR